MLRAYRRRERSSGKYKRRRLGLRAVSFCALRPRRSRMEDNG